MTEKLCEKSKRITREPWHRYIVPGYDGEDGFPEYRFRWELFGEAVFYTSVDMSIQPVTFCCFSRAKLSDIDLLSLINEPPITSNSSTDPVLDASESEVKCDEGGYDSDEDIAREMAALDLPSSFGQSSRQERSCRRCERKYRNYHIREKSPHHECLSDYLFCNGPYLERKSWFHDYPESFFSTEVAENFDKYTNQNCAPYALLKEHEQARAFFGASYSKLDHKREDCSGCWFHMKKNSIKNQIKENPKNHEMEGSAKDEEKRYPASDQDRIIDNLFKTDNDWNSLYLKHKEIVENRIAKDYNKYRKESNTRRCLEFSDKLASVGLTCKKEDSSTDEDDDDYLETGIPGLQRQRPFHIFDIHYDFQIPQRFIQKNRRIYPHTNEDKDDTNDFTMAGAENGLESLDSMFKDFDFGYSDERDNWLLAMNALKTFADDKDMPKYYNQRFRLFSKLNEGILMDREGWYSVTPERIAAHIADRLVIMKDTVVLDGFAGVGGNCIQFALKGAYVIALDMDPVRLRCAKRNAEIYGVADRINFICIDFFNFCKFHCEKVRQLKMGVREKQNDTFRSLGYDTSKLWKRRRIREKVADDFKQVQKAEVNDGFEIMGKRGAGKNERTVLVEIDTDDEDDFGIVVDNCHYVPIIDAVLLSPPWGGPSYLKSKFFSLKNMDPKGDKIFRTTRKLTHNIAYYLPRQTDVKELIRLSKDTGGIVEIEQAEVNRKVKAITAYYGELACDASW
uniref:Trimethylguanosine synthase n=1 Tax=Onchocerca volvulus TaxID=6282 RepID=A0A8R1Y3T9_ONCVO